MSSRAGFATLFAALTILVAGIFWFNRDLDSVAVSPDGNTASDRSAESVEDDAADESRDAITETQTTSPEVTLDAPSVATTGDELHDIRGRVVDDESGNPIAEASVYFDGSLWDVTDSLGGFELPLPKGMFELGTSHPFLVWLEDAHVFSGSLPLELEITLRVPPRDLLRGRLVCNTELDYEAITLTVRVPATGKMYAGQTPLDHEGRFEILVSAPVPTSGYHLYFGDARSSIVDAVLPVAILTEGDGPTIEAEVSLVTLRAQRPDDTPIKGVDVRILPIVDLVLPRWTVISTPESGEFEFLLADGPYELCASHPEYLSVVREFALPEENTLVLTLDPISDLPGVRAQVLGPGGEPVNNALITVAPKTRNGDASVAASVQRRTDADGIAILPIAQDLPYDWVAFDKRRGLIERDTVVAGTGTVLLRFQIIGGIRVVPKGRASVGASASDPMQWILAKHASLFGAKGESSLSQFTINELEPSTYDLFLYAPDGVAYGEATATVHANREERVEVHLDTGGVLRGVVKDASGNPVPDLELFLAHPTWPMQVVNSWGRKSTDAQGAFSFRTGNASTVGIVAMRDGAVIVDRQGLGTDSEHVITLD